MIAEIIVVVGGMILVGAIMLAIATDDGNSWDEEERARIYKETKHGINCARRKETP